MNAAYEHPMLPIIKEWEDLFMKMYKRAPRPIEREQFFLGLLYGKIAEARGRIEEYERRHQ